jgi:hypothetical protein
MPWNRTRDLSRAGERLATRPHASSVRCSCTVPTYIYIYVCSELRSAQQACSPYVVRFCVRAQYHAQLSAYSLVVVFKCTSCTMRVQEFRFESDLIRETIRGGLVLGTQRVVRGGASSRSAVVSSRCLSIRISSAGIIVWYCVHFMYCTIFCIVLVVPCGIAGLDASL